LNQLRNTIDLRQANTQLVLRHLCFNGPMSRIDLSQQTKLSPSTLTNVTSELLQNGILIETDLEKSAGGRPRAILDFNPTMDILWDRPRRNAGSTRAF
jgi:predicted transcriptional regulator